MHLGRLCTATLTLFLLAPATGGLAQEYAVLRGHQRRVTGVAFSSDNRSICSVSGEGGRVWEVITAKERIAFQSDRVGLYQGVALSPDGRTAALGVDNDVELWDLASCRRRANLRGSDHVVGITFSSDGKMIAAGTARNQVDVWGLPHGRPLALLPHPRGPASAVAFSPDSMTLATSSSEDRDTSRVTLWDIPTFRVRRVWKEESLGPSFLMFTSDGRTLMLGELFGVVKRWDISAGKKPVLVRKRSERGGNYLEMAFSPCGTVLATGDRDGAVRLEDLTSGKELAVLRKKGPAIQSLAFSSDGALLAAGLERAPDGSYADVLLWKVTLAKNKVSPDLEKGRAKMDFPAARQKTDSKNKSEPSRRLETLWADLANPDARRAYHAMWALVEKTESTVSFLKGELRPIPDVDRQRLANLVAGLNAAAPAARDSATRELRALGELAGPALREGFKDLPSEEMRRRLQLLLKPLEGPTEFPATMRAVRAVEVLEYIATPEACQVLQGLARGAPAAWQTQHAQAALHRLAKRAACLNPNQ
jgi:hypothetical protein